MKVMHLVCFYPEIAGQFTVSRELCKKLSEKGIEVNILSTLPKNYNLKKLIFLDELPFNVNYIREQMPSILIPGFSYKLFKLIREANVDIIHVHTPFYFYNLATYISSKKYVISLHGTFMKGAYEIKKLKKTLYMSLLGRFVLKKSSAIIVNTLEEKKQFLNYYPYLYGKTIVIPNGIDINNFYNHSSCIDKNYLGNKQTKGKTKILFLGRIHKIKGLDILIEGFAYLYNENKDVHLIIAGKDDGNGYEYQVRCLVKKFGLESAVTFAGFLDGKDKMNALFESDIFILPSYSENFGMSVVEAMAAGLPVVVTNKVAISSEISKWRSGIIIDCSAKSVYKGLKNLINMEDNIKNEMIKRGISMVKEYFDINMVADKVIELYKNVLTNQF
jgi:glycosyltransferase involved in cell wall biosynthesis